MGGNIDFNNDIFNLSFYFFDEDIVNYLSYQHYKLIYFEKQALL